MKTCTQTTQEWWILKTFWVIYKHSMTSRQLMQICINSELHCHIDLHVSIWYFSQAILLSNHCLILWYMLKWILISKQSYTSQILLSTYLIALWIDDSLLNNWFNFCNTCIHIHSSALISIWWRSFNFSFRYLHARTSEHLYWHFITDASRNVEVVLFNEWC